MKGRRIALSMFGGGIILFTALTILAGPPTLTNQALAEGNPQAYYYYYQLLPMALRDHIQAPDLAVTQMTFTDDTVTVVIENRGDGAAPHGFWVEVYISPNTEPTGVNQPWESLGAEGLVWVVEGEMLPLRPGERIALTTDDVHFRPALSHLEGTPAEGTAVYVQVDSYNPATGYGLVLETHEISERAYNNIFSIFLGAE